MGWRDEFEDAFVLREEAGAGGRVSEEAIKARRSGGQGLLADCGRRSWGGESSKHSLSDMEEDGDDGLSPPNRKGGS